MGNRRRAARARKPRGTWEWTALPDQSSQPAVSPQLRLGPRPRADKPQVRHGPGAASSQDNYSSVPGPSLVHPSLSWAPSGVRPGTCSTPGSADRAAGPGIETRAAVWAASSQAGTVRDPQGLHPVTGSRGRAQPAARQGMTRKTRRRRARRPPRGRGESFEPRTGHGTLNREPVTRSHGSCKLEPGKSGPGPAARQDSTTALRAQQSRADLFDSDQLSTVQFRPSSVGQVRVTVTLERYSPCTGGRGGILVHC